MAYILEHTRIGFCWFDLIALIILAALTIMYIVKVNKLKKEQEELEEQLKESAKLPAIEDYAE